ncbi:hypothetical protein KKF84_21195 [Myxococcota bacterium]|nr:hypothetical protein [Myxococcota bacterium]
MSPRTFPLVLLLMGALSLSCETFFGDEEDPDTLRVMGASQPMAVGSHVFLGFYISAGGVESYGSLPVLSVTFSDPDVARVLGVSEASDGVWIEVVGEGTGTLKVTIDETYSAKQTTSVQITTRTPTGMEFRSTCTGGATLPGAVFRLPYTLFDEAGELQGSIDHRAMILAPDGSVIEPLMPVPWTETGAPWSAALEFTPVFGDVSISVEGFPEVSRQVRLLNTTMVEETELTNVETSIRTGNDYGGARGDLLLHEGGSTVCLERQASEILRWEVLSGDVDLCSLLIQPEWYQPASAWRIVNMAQEPCVGELSLGEGSIAPPVTVEMP